MIVYLQPKTPFSKAVPRSDTLFGAICWSICLLYGETELSNLLAKFQENTAPFVLSSLFPYVQNRKGEKVLFLPRPLLPPSTLELGSKEDYEKLKKSKKAKYVSEQVFNSILDGTYEEKKDSYVIESNAVMTKTEQQGSLSEFFKQTEIARNTINRLTNATKLYYEPIVAINKEQQTGFYFLVKLDPVSDKQVRPMLKAALSFLQEKGFGGNSSVGFGQCQVEVVDQNPIKDFKDGNQLVTLSLMFPNLKDREHLSKSRNNTYAQIERRKGFLESSYLSGRFPQVWKPTLFMLTEGSNFPCDNDRKLYGQLFEDKRAGLDFNPRINGLAYTVAIKSNQKGDKL